MSTEVPLFAEVDALFGAEKYPEALSLMMQALDRAERAFGDTHANVAECCFRIATLHHLMGAPADALRHYERAVAILNQLSVEALDAAVASLLATACFNLGRLHHEQGDPAAALPAYQRALRLREQLSQQPDADPELARTLSNLGSIHDELGESAQALADHQRSLAIWERIDPATTDEPVQLNIAACLNDLATSYTLAGAYEQALVHFERALHIRRQELGEPHPDVGQSRNNLACLYADLGWHAEAMPLYEQELAAAQQRIQRLRDQPEDSDQLLLEELELATRYNNLGRLFEDMRQPDQGLPASREALRIREARLDSQDPLLANSLCNLGRLAAACGDADEALELHERALAVRKERLGDAHPAVALSLHGLGELARMKGQRDEAIARHDDALRIRGAQLGPAHLETLRSKRDLAALLLQPDPGRARELLRQALAGAEATLRQVRTIAHEPRLAAFLATLTPLDDVIYRCLAQRIDDAAARELALATALLHKGRTLDEMADLSQAVHSSLATAEQRAQLARLQELERQVSTLGLRAVLTAEDKSDPAAIERRAREAEQLRALRRDADQLEAQLARSCRRLGLRRDLPGPDQIIAAVARALPADAALIEYVSFGARYLALVLLADGTIEAVELGNGVDEAAAALLKELAPNKEVIPLAHDLWQLIMAPLQPLLHGRKRIFLAAEGALHLVPFAALHDGEDYLLGRYEFIYVTSGRDLLVTDKLPSGEQSVVIADPDFAAIAKAGRPLSPLPGARAEGAAIAQALRASGRQVQELVGAAATEETVRSLSRPEILHVATHGMFLDAALTPRVPGPSGPQRKIEIRLRKKMGDDPLLRSTLVFAGSPHSAQDDGLITALELASMNLWGTKLVVLSACQTGQGEVRQGQGVYGLRRAVMVAGAETLVTSLWAVHDAATRELMICYYAAIMTGAGRVAALDRAAQQVRQRYEHPFFWAPFIAMGRSDAI